jgi:hypothetical protein
MEGLRHLWVYTHSFINVCVFIRFDHFTFHINFVFLNIVFIPKPSILLFQFVTSFGGALASGWDTCKVRQQDEYGMGRMSIEPALFYSEVRWSTLRKILNVWIIWHRVVE